jgi:hypothetical protein
VALVHADQLPWRTTPDALCSRLARAVVRLMQAGWPPSFIMMYDEVRGALH